VKYLAVAIMFLVLCPLAFGQSGAGYAFFAPSQSRGGGDSAFVTHFGGGGRWTAKSGVGFGAELGIGGPKGDFGEACAGVFSPNGYYVFKTGNEKVQPFVTGGYTRTFGHRFGLNWGNFGAGVTYWAAPRVGLLIEFRDHVARERGQTVQLYGIRLGVAFK
jgi:hypothetical protein